MLPAVLLAGLFLVSPGVAAISHPRVQWVFQTEGPIRGSATIAGDALYFGSADGFLYAVDRADGTFRWKFQIGGAIAGAPAVADDLVIVAGRGEMVHALDRADGTSRWSFRMKPTLPTPTEWNFFTAPPVVDGDQVLVPSGDGHLYALDLRTGAERWKFETGDSLRAAPLVVGDVIYQPSGDDHVYALAAAHGALRWKFATAGVGYDLSQGFIRSDIFTRPSYQDGLLVFGSRDANVYAVDATTGEKKWSFAYDSTWAMSTTVEAGAVYAGWSTNNKINALDLATGAQRWEFNAGSHTYTTGLVMGEAIIWASADGRIRQLGKRDGQLQWTYDVGSDLYSSPVQADGVLYLGTDDGRMLAIAEGHATAYKAVYVPAAVPAGLRGFVIDEALAPYLVAHAFQWIDSATALADWVNARTADGAPSVVVFGFAQIPPEVVGADPAAGPLRKYLEAGGKVVWTWGRPNLVTFDEKGQFLAYDPSVATRLLGLEFVDFQDSGNYYSRPTQTGRNWGLPAWFKATFASLKSASGATALATDEYGRTSVFVKAFHPRPGSGWVTFSPKGYGVPIRESELTALERVASHGLD